MRFFLLCLVLSLGWLGFWLLALQIKAHLWRGRLWLDFALLAVTGIAWLCRFMLAAAVALWLLNAFGLLN